MRYEIKTQMIGEATDLDEQLQIFNRTVRWSSFADADWSGDRQSRKSVSACMILHGKHLIKAWTKQQSVVADSTAEAELYAGNRAATESMGAQAATTS